jgi:hypothetical protein
MMWINKLKLYAGKCALYPRTLQSQIMQELPVYRNLRAHKGGGSVQDPDPAPKPDPCHQVKKLEKDLDF